MRAGLPLLLLAVSQSAAAQRPTYTADLVYSRDTLTGGFQDWNSLQVNFSRSAGRGRTLYGSALATERFGTDDTQFTLGAYNPVAPRLISLIEVSHSPTHRVLARLAGTAQLQWEVGKGYVVTGGLNRTEFQSDTSTGFIGGVEKYWGQYRAAYFFTAAEARRAGFAAGHRFSLNRYYNERTNLGFTLAIGQEVESVGIDRVIRNDVLGLVLSGRIGVGKRDSLSADLGYFRQGDLYIRRSVSVGFRHAF